MNKEEKELAKELRSHLRKYGDSPVVVKTGNKSFTVGFYTCGAVQETEMLSIHYKGVVYNLCCLSYDSINTKEILEEGL